MRQEIRDIIEGKRTIRSVEAEDRKNEGLPEVLYIPRKIRPLNYFTKNSVFYVIQILPRDERRYKVGYTTCMLSRLKHHQVMAPDCVLLEKHSCHPANEYLIINRLKSLKGVLPISREVMDVEDNKLFIGYLRLMFKAVDMTVVQEDNEEFQKALCFQRNRVKSEIF